ncbi:hypothetical protein ABMA70_01695 [Halobacteriovorax sp. XZX-3]|uniref:hypothetical protein n=1 Tax=unclassified Halobacteriovorax TaxID=2639665 RepID=UPI000CD1BFFB|nr:hypothetical protein [Halobacteriovorax sp. DA5]POB14461.1 hypothetical protein C0Z22_05040 [Halobacteriovorax sp. DA5]
MRRAIIITLLLLFNFTGQANKNQDLEWEHDFSFDNIQVWKNSHKRLTVEDKNSSNKIENYNKEKIRKYLDQRNKILKYSDFSQFKTESLDFTKKKNYIQVYKLGSYKNSRSKTIYLAEIHRLYKNRTIITMLSSEKKISKSDIKDLNEKFKFVTEQR